MQSKHLSTDLDVNNYFGADLEKDPRTSKATLMGSCLLPVNASGSILECEMEEHID
jgi:hypothetical protein